MQRSFDVPRIWHLKTDQFVRRVDDVGVVCLFPVMVLRGHPENGEHRPGQQTLEPLCQTNRRNALVESIKRAPQEPGLLAGRDDHTSLLDPSVEALRVEALRNRQRPESPPSGIRIESCVDSVQEGTIGLRVLP